MRNVLLGFWVCLLSITMMAGILFPFQGIVLGVLGLFAGCILFFKARTDVHHKYIDAGDNFHSSLQREVGSVEYSPPNINERVREEMDKFKESIKNIKPDFVNPLSRFVIRLRRCFVSYINDEGVIGSLDYAKIFDSAEEAQDYIDFVPMGKQRNWSKEDVVVVILVREMT